MLLRPTTSATLRSAKRRLAVVPLFDSSRHLRGPRRGLATSIHDQDSRRQSNFVKIVEVSPRDGLQNEKNLIPTETKLQLIQRLEKTGLSVIESGAFVSPKWVPQMADTPNLLSRLEPQASISYPVLVPNSKGLSTLLSLLSSEREAYPSKKPATGEIAVFISASEAFSHANLNCSISDSLSRLEPVISTAIKHDLKVRGYISVVAGCPFSGPESVSPQKVAELTQILLQMGCYEISLGDTVGYGTPEKLLEVLAYCYRLSIGSDRLAAHCHDTFGTGIANVLAMVKQGGIRVVDSSVGGLGGCPYSPGATGNIDTESVLYTLHNEGFQTGVDLKMTAEIGQWISDELGRNNASRAGKAVLAREQFLQQRQQEEKSR